MKFFTAKNVYITLLLLLGISFLTYLLIIPTKSKEDIERLDMFRSMSVRTNTYIIEKTDSQYSLLDTIVIPFKDSDSMKIWITKSNDTTFNLAGIKTNDGVITMDYDGDITATKAMKKKSGIYTEKDFIQTFGLGILVFFKEQGYIVSE